MKKQILALIMTLTAASVTMAAPPIVIGAVTFKDELVILNKTVVCKAYMAPTNDIRPETLVNGTYMAAMAQEDGSILVDGNLDGDFFEITGNPNESIHISLQQSGTATNGKAPAYSFSSSGSFTHNEVHGQKVQTVSLNVTLNGKSKSVGCSLR